MFGTVQGPNGATRILSRAGTAAFDRPEDRRYSFRLRSPSMQTRQPVPTYFGRYQVLEELGSGAMGVVYLCVDARLARPVAVKVSRESEHMTPAEKQQFRDRRR